MKIGLLADIHGNADALAVVLSDARRKNVKQLIMAGDLVGYYYDVSRVLDLLGEWTWHGVRGNHEDMIEDHLSGGSEAIKSRYGSGLARGIESLSKDRLAMLRHLDMKREVRLDGRALLVCHGSPWDTNAYVYPTAKSELRRKMARTAGQVDVVVFGHTHYPVTWTEVRDDGKPIILVNPGSVGQPRDRKPGACYAILDTATLSIEQFRVPYDRSSIVAACRRNDPELPHLTEVLSRDG